MYRLLLCVHRHEALLNFLYLKPTTLLLVIHFTCLQNCNVVLIFYLETDHVCGHFSDSWNTYFRNVSFFHAFFSHIPVSFSTFSSFSCYLHNILLGFLRFLILGYRRSYDVLYFLPADEHLRASLQSLLKWRMH